MPFIIRAPLLAAAAWIAAAQTSSQLLTLDDCIRLSQSAQSNLSIARLETQIATQGINQARAAFLPLAHVGAGYTYNTPLPSNDFSFASLQGIHEYIALFNLGAEIDTSGRLRAGLARARADRDIAGMNASITQRDLRRAVTASYYRLLLARHLIQATHDSLAEAQSFESRTRLLVENGEAAQADNVKAAAQSAFLLQMVSSAELEGELANHDLASFWLTDVNNRLEIADTLAGAVPSPESEQADTGVNPFMRRFEFSLFDAQKRGFLADARRARADLYPSLGFNFQYGFDALSRPLANRGAATFFTLNVPVFDWFKTRSAIRQFDLRLQQVDVSRAIAVRAFSREYADALARAKRLYEQISVTESQVKLSERNLELGKVRYEGGEGPALDVVAAQSQLAQARGNYYLALAGYLNARADLEVAAGR